MRPALWTVAFSAGGRLPCPAVQLRCSFACQALGCSIRGAALVPHRLRPPCCRDRGTLPLDVASWSAGDTFEYKGEVSAVAAQPCHLVIQQALAPMSCLEALQEQQHC